MAAVMHNLGAEVFAISDHVLHCFLGGAIFAGSFAEGVVGGLGHWMGSLGRVAWRGYGWAVDMAWC